MGGVLCARSPQGLDGIPVVQPARQPTRVSASQAFYEAWSRIQPRSASRIGVRPRSAHPPHARR